ncbi:MAG TPA: hypothetical protein VFH03_08865 [Actinoplanes sp.]|nr:hypothetical protein [Actinoplanes sp.]
MRNRVQLIAYADRLGGTLHLVVPGIPQVYYVGLLPGHNQRVTAGADPREINRRRYTAAEVEQALTRPVVRASSG